MVIQITLKTSETMYFGQEQATEIIGCFCTLLDPNRGYREGQVIADYGYEVEIRLTNGRKVTMLRDDVLIMQ